MSNSWEEIKASGFKNIAPNHESVLNTMEIPKWMNVNCPYCNVKLDLRSIREFGLKLNTRNIGDIFVQVCCEECGKMDTLYFKSEANTITEFINIINGNNSPKSVPMLEDNMYKENYNNLLEKIYAESCVSKGG